MLEEKMANAGNAGFQNQMAFQNCENGPKSHPDL